MAKAFYTQDEAKVALSTSEDGLKDLVRDGRLTEYRDGQNLMYKGTQVEKLAGEMKRDAVSLSDSATGMDSGGASGSIIGLADDRSSASGSGPGFAKDDTAGGFELAEEPQQEQQPSRQALHESGITIFGTDEEAADPMAQTQLGDTSGEQVNLEGIGSGSGLLDLTSEVGEDTSFGAETFEEIMPGEGSGMGTISGMEDMETGAIDTGALPPGARGMMVAYEAYDPQAPIFGGLAGGAAFAVLLGLLGVAAAATGAAPGLLGMFFNDDGTVNTIIALAVLLGLPIIGAVIGFVGGRMATS